MPDLTIVNMRQCQQLSYWEGDIGKYKVSLGHFRTCTCPHFTFRHKPCKHIEQAEKQRCTWHEQWSDEKIGPDYRCPVCGGPTEVVRVGV